MFDPCCVPGSLMAKAYAAMTPEVRRYFANVLRAHASTLKIRAQLSPAALDRVEREMREEADHLYPVPTKRAATGGR